jgi:hypothetical protein
LPTQEGKKYLQPSTWKTARLYLDVTFSTSRKRYPYVDWVACNVPEDTWPSLPMEKISYLSQLNVSPHIHGGCWCWRH